MRDTDVAPKCAAFREARNAYDAVSVARRDHALATADYFKIAGRNFEVELESAVAQFIFVFLAAFLVGRQLIMHTIFIGKIAQLCLIKRLIFAMRIPGIVDEYTRSF